MGKCKICGKSTKRDYSLCSDCYELFQAGEIVQCEECDTFHYIDKPCPECGIYESLPKEGFTECVLCGNKTKGHAFCKDCWEEHDDEDLLEMLNDIISDRNKWEKCPDCGEIFDAFSVCDCKVSKKDELTCIICGEPSNGKHFCLDCWKAYQNKTIYLKIVNCKSCVPLGAEYEGHLETSDGHIVKSHVERDIDNYLFRNNIPHAYEPTYDVDGNPEHEFRPDFYLPNYLGQGKEVYIEYFGMKGTKDGDRKINYKMPIYQRDKVTLICLYPQDDNRIEAVLKRKLNKANIKVGEINEK